MTTLLSCSDISFDSHSVGDACSFAISENTCNGDDFTCCPRAPGTWAGVEGDSELSFVLAPYLLLDPRLGSST